MDRETRVLFAARLKRQIEEHKQFLAAVESEGFFMTCNDHDIKPEMVAKEREIISHLEQLVETVEDADNA